MKFGIVEIDSFYRFCYLSLRSVSGEGGGGGLQKDQWDNIGYRFTHMFYFKYSFLAISQPAFTCSKLTIETLEHRLPAGLIGLCRAKYKSGCRNGRFGSNFSIKFSTSSSKLFLQLDLFFIVLGISSIKASSSTFE